ncbi:unnamed protein product [Lampetra fluviatilis]
MADTGGEGDLKRPGDNSREQDRSRLVYESDCLSTPQQKPPHGGQQRSDRGGDGVSRNADSPAPRRCHGGGGGGGGGDPPLLLLGRGLRGLRWDVDAAHVVAISGESAAPRAGVARGYAQRALYTAFRNGAHVAGIVTGAAAPPVACGARPGPACMTESVPAPPRSSVALLRGNLAQALDSAERRVRCAAAPGVAVPNSGLQRAARTLVPRSKTRLGSISGLLSVWRLCSFRSRDGRTPKSGAGGTGAAVGACHVTRVEE